MKSRSQARPSRRYRRYDTAATLSGRLDTRPRPRFAPQVNLDWLADLSKPRVTAALLVVLVAAAAWLGLDDRFYVTQLSVTGATRTPPLEVANMSGLVGTHIFWANAAEAEARLLRSTPALKSARVTCQLPAYCSLQVVERTPLIAWQYGQAVTWVDADGATFDPRAAQPDLNLITIEAAQGPALIAGQPADPTVIAAAVSVAQAMPDVRRYRYSGAHGLEFDDERGFPVYLGLADDMSDRVMIWQALRASLIARGVQPKFVDVRYPLAPFYGE
jgi:cell division septal protein FtsQ